MSREVLSTVSPAGRPLSVTGANIGSVLSIEEVVEDIEKQLTDGDATQHMEAMMERLGLDALHSIAMDNDFFFSDAATPEGLARRRSTPGIRRMSFRRPSFAPSLTPAKSYATVSGTTLDRKKQQRTVANARGAPAPVQPPRVVTKEEAIQTSWQSIHRPLSDEDETRLMTDAEERKEKGPPLVRFNSTDLPGSNNAECGDVDHTDSNETPTAVQESDWLTKLAELWDTWYHGHLMRDLYPEDSSPDERWKIYMERRAPPKYKASFVQLWGLGVASVISGEFAGWNTGIHHAGYGGFWVATVLAAILYAGIAGCLSELSSSIPVPGGAFAYTRAVLGNGAAFFVGSSE
ncbi:hypothetical protein HDU93_000529, partial [Gonapodya sp. JEL0774]